MNEQPNQIEIAYQICKAQASVDCAYEEPLLRHWFEAAWDLCADMVDLTPAQQIKEPLQIDTCGQATLSYRPSGPVEILDGYTVVAVVPRPFDRRLCYSEGLCCLCMPYARYNIGQDMCQLPPRFVQAVARVFAYLVENHGDSGDDHVLTRCGAMSFLGPDVQYVL